MEKWRLDTSPARHVDTPPPANRRMQRTSVWGDLKASKVWWRPATWSFRRTSSPSALQESASRRSPRRTTTTPATSRAHPNRSRESLDLCCSDPSSQQSRRSCWRAPRRWWWGRRRAEQLGHVESRIPLKDRNKLKWVIMQYLLLFRKQRANVRDPKKIDCMRRTMHESLR